MSSVPTPLGSGSSVAMDPSFILEDYMKTVSMAVLKVAESVENIKGGESLSPEEAAYLSVAMYGAPPKPSASSVASLLKQGINDRDLSEDVLLKMSVARRGQETNMERANAAVDDICTIMEDITGRGFKYSSLQHNLAESNKVHIGMRNDTTPVVACDRYEMQENVGAPEVTVDVLKSQPTIIAVEKNLSDIFRDVQDKTQQQQNLTFVKTVVEYVKLGDLIAWGDNVEKAIRGKTCEEEIVSTNAGAVKNAVQTIYGLVGSSYCRTATQLTSAQDIRKLKKAADTCYEALMADTREKAIVNFLFYVNFKVVEGSDSKEFVKKRLSTMAGDKKPVILTRRTAEDMLFGACFLLKVMSREFVACILTFPTVNPYHGLSGTCLEPLLKKHGPSFDKSWALFNHVLQQRNDAIKSLTGKPSRVDTLDAYANLTGPVYVLILDLARTLTHQRTCSKNFLDKITEQYFLWNKFVEG